MVSRRGMPRTKVRVVIIALAALVIAIVSLWVATGLKSPWNAVLAAIASTVLTIGIVNLVSDLVLQRSVSADLMDFIESDRRLVESGLDGLEPVEDIDWLELLTQGTSVEFLVLDPSLFSSVIWTRVLEAGRRTQMDVQIIVVDQKSTFALDVAKRLSLTRVAYLRSVREATDAFESQWKAMRAHSKAHSTLVLSATMGLASMGYARTERTVVLFVPALDSLSGVSPVRGLRIKTSRRGVPIAGWVLESIERVQGDSLAPLYSDRPAVLSPEGKL